MNRTCCILATALFAAQAAFAQIIPDDPEFRTGKLANGLSYYLCHNEKPEGCAEFYIAHNVGALQEEDNQNGLAHFLEHMAFNGTRHYPGKGILDFLAKEGVRFGYNVNAYTSRTETVYNLSKVPLVRDSFVDSVLMVLHDWSCDISCEQQALDDERGVISEEWRFRNDPRSRMANKQSALIYKGSKYADRDVIGTLEVINGFKRHEILDFYHKWYRPDLQAIIVVGDFDTARMEGRIRELFSDIPAAVNPTPKESYISPVLSEDLFADMTDPEIKYQAYKAIYKQRFTVSDPKDEAYHKDFFCRQIVSSVLADRMRKRSKEKGSPAQSATMVTSVYQPDLYVSLITVVPKKKDRLLDCLEFTELEVRRMLQHGISADELEVAKINIASRFHLNQESSREDTKNAEIVPMALGAFLQGAPLVLPETMKELRKAILDGISPEDIAPYPAMMLRDCEKIYTNSYNSKDDAGIAPAPEQMKAALAKVDAESVDPEFLDYPELDLKLDVKPGRIVKTAPVKGKDMEKWTLSNGVQVFYKKAEPVKSGQSLYMTLLFDTGYRAFEQDKVDASSFAMNYNKRNAGFRNCSKTEFRNYPEMNGVGIILSFTPQAGRIMISSRADRVETAFKSAYLQITEPYFGTERELELAKASQLKSLGKKKSARNLYDIKCRDIAYGKHPWLNELDSAAVNATDMALLEDSYKRIYGDISHMKLVLCSDLPREQISTLVEQYIASLDTSYPYGKGKYFPVKPVIKGHSTIMEKNKPVAAPYTDISCNYFYKGGRSIKERAQLDILDYILSARYLALIREERGGAYSVSFRTEVNEEAGIPSHSYVDFRTRPELREMLLQDVQDVLDKMCKEGPTAEEMELAVKYLVKHDAEKEALAKRSLSTQEDRMLSYVRWGTPYGYDYEGVVRSVKASDVRAMARHIAAGNAFIQVYTEE